MGQTLFTDLLAQYQAVLSLGMHNAGPATFALFRVFATIEMAMLGLWWMYSRDNHMGTLVMRVFAIGGFLWLAQEWQVIMGAVQASFMQLGIILGGKNLDMPSVHGAGLALINKGYELAMAIQGQPRQASVKESLLLAMMAPMMPMDAGSVPGMEKIVMGWTTWLFFAVAGIHVFVVQLEVAFGSAMAFVTIPFATWQRTAWMSERTFGFVIASGVKLMFIYMLTSASLPILTPAGTVVATQVDALGMMLVGMLLLFLQLGAGRMASGILHGMPSLTHTDVIPRVSAGIGYVSAALTMLHRRR